MNIVKAIQLAAANADASSKATMLATASERFPRGVWQRS